MSDANIEAHHRGEHRVEAKWSCPECLLHWANMIHRDLNIRLFDKEQLAAIKAQIERRRPRRMDP